MDAPDARPTNRAPAAARRAAILAAVRAIPAGWVRTYGDLSPGAPRLTGTVLRVTDEPGLPWHRVVRADGSLAKGTRQRALLDAEGVPFDPRGRVELGLARLPEHPGAQDWADVDPG